jgi:hypothetical protein
LHGISEGPRTWDNAGMAILLPADLDLSKLPHSERRVCESLMAGLDDSWYVIPSVPIVDDGKDGEIDVILVSAEAGVFVMEVKGGTIRLENGKWFQNDHEMKKSPSDQVTRNKHLLLNRLKRVRVPVPYVQHLLAFPDVANIPEVGLGPDVPHEIVFGHNELSYPREALAALAHPSHKFLSPDTMSRFLHALHPQITLDSREAGLAPVAMKRIDDATRSHIMNLANLDMTQRVLITGGAGTGKTWLIEEWAKRAADRNERTCLICFNKPIADHLQRQLDGTSVTVGTYHDVIRRLLEPFADFDVPEGAGKEFWDHVPTQRLFDRRNEVGAPFDTIIIDEFQDMRHHWMPSIEMLLDPDGPRRLLLVADPSQDIYVNDWQVPIVDVMLPLEFNLRSAKPVAEVVHRLGGPRPMPNALGTFPVLHWKAGGIKEIRKRVATTLEMLTEVHGVPFSQIAVLTVSRDLRDQLLEPGDPKLELPLVRWEDRIEEAALCETIHRGKGLEKAAVIIVDNSDEPKEQLVYIGASRAMWSLTMIGQEPLAHLCGIDVNSAAESRAYQTASGQIVSSSD